MTLNDILVNHFVRKGHPVFKNYQILFKSCIKDPADRVLKKLLVTNNYRSNVRPSFGIRTDSIFAQIKPISGPKLIYKSGLECSIGFKIKISNICNYLI